MTGVASQAVPRIPRVALAERLPWRRLLRWSALVVLAMLLLWLGAYGAEALRDSARFPVRRVAVDGSVVHTDRQQLKAVVSDYSDSGFYQADLAGLQSSLLALPWVRQVAIRKVLPDQLRIHLLEHKPVAIWNQNRLFSELHATFQPPAADVQQQREAGLPRLHGPDGQAETLWRAYVRWQSRLAELGLRVADVHRDARGAWRVALEQGPELLLGSEAADERLARWIAVQQGAQALDLARVERIDLRYTNGFSVAWKPAPTEQSGQQG